MARHALFPLSLILLAVPWLSASAQDPATGDPSIIPAGTRAELLFDGGSFTEGPAVGPDGKVYFSDMTNPARTGMQAGHLWRYDPETGQSEVYRSPSGMSNGIIFDQEGRMIVAEGTNFGGKRVTRTDMSTGKAMILAGLFEGRPFNEPNDLALDEAGRIYFTDPAYAGEEPPDQPVTAVYRIDPDGSVTRIIEDVYMPNGILVSPDQRTLYVASLALVEGVPGANGLLAYDLAADGSAEFREVLIDFAPGIGPDGMAIDVDGNLYLSRPRSPSAVAVYAPNGTLLGRIPVPGPVRNATFGRGPDANVLYITASGSLYRIRLNKAGYHASRW